MDPQQIAQMLASGKPEQIKAAQIQLQALGYDVKPDGKLGAATAAAVGKYRDDVSKNQERQTRGQEAAGKIAENDPTNRLIKTATDVVPYGVGIATGTGIGHYVFGNEAADRQLGQNVKALANTRGINPAIREEQLNALLRRRNMTDVGQFTGPGLLFGAGQFTRDYLAKLPQDKTAKDVINSIGLGENAAAASLGAHQLFTTLKSLKNGRGIDPVDVARIRSANMPDIPPSIPPAAPPSAPSSAPATPPDVGEPIQHGERVKLAAKAAGAKVGTKKAANVEAIKRNLNPDNMADVAQALKLPADASRPAILQRLREIGKTGGKLALPLAAGALAYEMAGNPAEAGNGSPEEPSTAGRLGAAGVAAGTAYGARALADKLPAFLRNAAGKVGTVAGKALGPELALASPEAMHAGEALTGAVGLPSFQQRMADRSGASELPARGERGLLGRRDLNAADLQIPANAYQPIPEQTQQAPAPNSGTGSASLPPVAAHLLAATAQDPQLADMVRSIVKARLGKDNGTVATPDDRSALALSLRNLASR